MSDWDKSLISTTFKVNREENTKCTILGATNVYDKSINNIDIRVII